MKSKTTEVIKKKGTKTKYRLLKMAALFLSVTLLLGGSIHYLVNAYMISQAEQNIRAMLLSHKGVHHYIQKNTHPALYRLQGRGILPENFYSPALLSSSYMVRNIHEYYNQEREKAGLPRLYYKLAAINPRNPVNRANPLEEKLIKRFNKEPDLESYRDLIEIKGQKHLYVALPFLKTKKACLKCHGTREQAPPQLKLHYNGDGGFGDQVGGIRAIESLSVPLQDQHELGHLLFAAFSCGFAALLGLFMATRHFKAKVKERTTHLEKEISERRQAQHALKRTHKRFQSVLDSLDGIVYVSDFQTNKILFLNQYAKQIWGDGVGQICWKLTGRSKNGPCKDCNNHKLTDSSGRISTGVQQRELYLKNTDQWYECRDRAITWSDGRLVRMEIATNITKRKKAEEKLRQNEESYRSLFNSISDFIYTHDLEGRILSINPLAAKSLGYQPGELQGEKISRFSPEGELIRFREKYLEELLKDGHTTGRYVILAKNGSEHYLECRANLVGKDKASPLVSGSARDVTEKMLARKKMLKMQMQLDQSRKMEAVGSLASGVAHDFNNALQSISGYVEMLYAEDLDKPKQREKLDQIGEVVGRAAELVRRLLTFSRKVEVELVPLDLNNEITESVKTLSRIIPKMITIEQRLSPKLKNISGDRVQIEQILMNLGVNAKDAMPNGGILTIETRGITLGSVRNNGRPGLKPGEYILLKVSDTGMGMDQKTINRIFEPFFTTKGPGQGTGLGLATVYGIVKSHKGDISCHSEPGRGTSFNIYLPACDQVQKVKKNTQFIDAELMGTETVLLVDDESSILEAASSILKRFGYAPLTAPCGEDALNIFNNHNNSIQLVILDLNMPGMGGEKCLEQLLEKDKSLKVIIASGYSVQAQAKESITKGAYGFMGKPYRLKELLKIIREALDNNRA